MTDHGRRLAELLGPALRGHAFALVLVSEPDLVEWNYGTYEGLTRG